MFRNLINIRTKILTSFSHHDFYKKIFYLFKILFFSQLGFKSGSCCLECCNNVKYKSKRSSSKLNLGAGNGLPNLTNQHKEVKNIYEYNVEVSKDTMYKCENDDQLKVLCKKINKKFKSILSW